MDAQTIPRIRCITGRRGRAFRLAARMDLLSQPANTTFFVTFIRFVRESVGTEDEHGLIAQAAQHLTRGVRRMQARRFRAGSANFQSAWGRGGRLCRE